MPNIPVLTVRESTPLIAGYYNYGNWHHIMGLCGENQWARFFDTGNVYTCGSHTSKVLGLPECVECLSQSIEVLHGKKH